MKRVLLLCGLLFASLPCFSAFVTANQLRNEILAYERFERGKPNSTDFQDSAHAIGYVVGVVDTLQGAVVCVPSGVSAGQAMAVVKKYLDDHPESWNLQAYIVIASAIQATFPCQK
jgi:hypothetical protein